MFLLQGLFMGQLEDYNKNSSSLGNRGGIY